MNKNKHYKALAVDLDGTLLGSNHEISKRDAQALRLLRKKGIPIIAVTGRTLEEIRAFDFCIGLAGDISVVQGGAVIVKFCRDRVIADYSVIRPEDRRILIDIAEKNGFFPLVYLGDSPFTQPHENKYHTLYEEMMKHKLFRVDNLKEVQERMIVGKISMLAPPGVLDRAEREMEQADLRVSWGRSFDFGTDICCRSKREALAEVLKEYGIERDGVVAVGDSDNDLEMIAYAGLGVAMGNATEQLRRAADYITCDNEHGGVANVIHTFF